LHFKIFLILEATMKNSKGDQDKAGSKDDASAASGASREKKKREPTKPCMLCKKPGHWTNECPEVASFQTWQEDQKAGDERVKQSLMSLGIALMTPFSKPTVQSVLTSENAIGLTKTMLVIDTGASHSLTPHRVLLNTESIRRCEPVNFRGISRRSASVVAREIGRVLTFPDVLYAPDAAATVISLSQYERRPDTRIFYNQQEQSYTIHIGGSTYLFTHHAPSGLKVCDLATPGAVSTSV
jgi:hypothetical protein